MGSPSADSLLALVKFNVFRALMCNARALGFSAEESIKDEAISPFCTSSGGKNNMLLLPSSLQPTQLQMQIPHHPWIDLLPIPKMRDNVLSAGDSFDEMGLCGDLIGFFSVSKGGTGMIVWGDPWDLNAWEITDAFLKNWGWTIRGCPKILESSNFWRSRRGESPLSWVGSAEETIEDVS
jgi:hypothetical protein